MITVWYDGQCGLCSREINHYRKLVTSTPFHWQDLSTTIAGLDRHQVSLPEALMALHAEDHDGKLHIGMDAFILIWRQFKGWALLARIAALPGIHQLSKRLYAAFARRRFAQLAHCQLALKSAEENRLG